MKDIIRVWESDGFRLEMYDTHRRDNRGQTRIGYVLSHNGQMVFDGEDFCGSPLHSGDSNATAGALLSFLSLRPGDTDREYFDNYTSEQMEFAQQHGEYLSLLAMELEETPDSEESTI